MSEEEIETRPARRGQIVNTAHSGGRTVCEMWVHLFETNEEAPKEKKLTDPEITAAMLKAFPDRAESAVFKEVQKVRNRYNRGILTKGHKPRRKSHKYERLEGGKLIRRELRIRKNEIPSKNVCNPEPPMLQ